MEMLEHLFEEFERCFDEIDTSKQLLSTVLCQSNTLYLRHGLLHDEIKCLRKDVVDQLLIYNEIKEQIEDICNAIEALEIQNEALERAVAEKSEALQAKTQSLKVAREKYDATVGALRDSQRRCNIKLLALQEAEEAGSKAHAALFTMLRALSDFKESKQAEISAVRRLVEETTAELTVSLEELRCVECEKQELERVIIEQKSDFAARCEDFEKLRCSESLCRTRLSELSRQLMEARDALKQHSTVLADLEREESLLVELRQTLMAEAADLQRALQTASDHFYELEQKLSSTDAECSYVSTCINDTSKLRSTWAHHVMALRERTTQCASLLSNIASTAAEIDELQRQLSALDAENTGLMDEISTWSNKNSMLEQEITRVQCALRSLEDSRSSLKEALESETNRSRQLCEEVDELNKGITQSRLLLGDLKKKYAEEQHERNARLSELRQRHLDEYKEKQSVKICDLKSALKSERASVIQSKKDNIAKALEERAAQLRNNAAEQERCHQRKLCEEARIISLLQAELRNRGCPMCALPAATTS
ncbi:hypothetical protein BBBOND_0312260 [Babesia bigemina]|uniref:Uncharacterized protein n=1 Tax=Babesia bigemina TaxID=5866 RepID=A0A061D9Z2_BABBI|nr:hypothetical protein BBBOND_0312260 [Babesia bigemina]CDR97323.1 hypothetical protein BBBOND_0312260 [Babesia bigemina]|eukprot:XP_012769509.1 hypothetical protein BBBOND_0312260 [Babesia bigemina]